MAKKNTLYNLRIDDFNSVINDYVSSLSDIEFVRDNKAENHIIFRFKRKTEKRPCSNLHCYIKQSRVSFHADGKSPEIANAARDHLIELTTINVGESRTFTVKSVSSEEVETATAFLCEECECTLEVIEPKNESIQSIAKITGKYKDTISIIYYNTGTLLVQGRPCFTFQNFMAIASELFNPAEVKKEHLMLFNISEDEDVINTDLSSHIPNAYEHIGTKLDAIMAPSLILLNNAKEMPDYSACAFPVLRGSEGVLKSIFSNEGIDLENFGDYFKFNTTNNRCEWTKDTSSLFPEEAFRNNLLSLYRFYHAHRHTTFHCDATIETSRTLNYEQALEIVNQGLIKINNIYIHLS